MFCTARYDPYAKEFSREYYDTDQMHTIRKDAIKSAANARRFGLILGTLGRQGNPKVLDVCFRMPEEGQIKPLIPVLDHHGMCECWETRGVAVNVSKTRGVAVNVSRAVRSCLLMLETERHRS
jgi:diphthamide synthase subunit DPH2